MNRNSQRWIEQSVSESTPGSSELGRAAKLRHLREVLKRKSAEHKEGELERRIPTGISGVDHLLQGGFLRGALTMISGAWVSGKTSLALSPLIRASRELQRSAIIDVTGCLFPPVLSRMGIDLERVLFVRPGHQKAVWATEQILRSGIFQVVMLIDAIPGSEKLGLKLGSRVLRRLQLASEAANTIMLVVHANPVHAGVARMGIRVESHPSEESRRSGFLPRLSIYRRVQVSVFRGAEAGSALVEL